MALPRHMKGKEKRFVIGQRVRPSGATSYSHAGTVTAEGGPGYEGRRQYWVRWDGSENTTLIYSCDLMAERTEGGEIGVCDTCGRRRLVTNAGTADYPEWKCGTCQHRHARRTNTHEMYGHGRRGY